MLASVYQEMFVGSKNFLVDQRWIIIHPHQDTYWVGLEHYLSTI